jgi:FKBP-type peptidyl-prolyl cis-trans isomerase FkpA
MLKNVNVLFLNFKTINLPVVTEMNRILLILFVSCLFIAACKKEDTSLKLAQAQAIKDDKIIQDFLVSYQDTLTANNWTVNKLDSAGVFTGIYYIVVDPGNESSIFTNSTQVAVGYNARILGTENIVAHTNTFHPAFVLSQVIRGWRLGVPVINKGGEVRLIVPSYSAYGPFPQQSLGLPANSILYFDIKLYDVIN